MEAEDRKDYVGEILGTPQVGAGIAFADTPSAILALHARVTALETQLYALQRATAHITSIQPIKG